MKEGRLRPPFFPFRSVERLVVPFGKHALHPFAQYWVTCKQRISCENSLSLLACILHERKVGRKVRDVQRGQAVLPPAEKVARPALGKVGAGDLEAVARAAQDLSRSRAASPLSAPKKMQ